MHGETLKVFKLARLSVPTLQQLGVEYTNLLSPRPNI